MSITKEVNDEALKENFDIVGSPTIVNKVVSNFSLSNYITIPNYLPSTYNSLEFVIKFSTPENFPNEDMPIINQVGVIKDIFIDHNNTKIAIWTGSSYAGGTTTLQRNKTYYLKIIYNGSRYTYKLSENGESWTDEIVNTTLDIFKGAKFHFGSSGIEQWFRGSIDLADTYIKVNDEIWWQPYIPIPRGSVEVGQGYCNVDGTNKIIFLNSVKKDFEDIGGTKGFKNNVVVTLDNSNVSSFILQGVEAGNPTGYKATKALDKFVYLNNNKDMILGDSPKGGLGVSLPLDITPVGGLKISDGVASNFSKTNYINTGKIFNFHDSDSWEIGYTIIPKTVSKDQWIFGAASFVQDVIFPLGFISRGNFQILASYAGTSWDVAGTGSHSVQVNTKYWIRYGFNGSYYYFKYSLDGINFIEDIRVSSSTRVVANTSVVVGIGRNAFSSDPSPWIDNFFEGSMDLKETYVRIGTNVWTPLVKSAIDVSKGYAYSDETNGYLDIESSSSFALQEAVIHPEAFSISSYKPDYVINGTPTISEDYLASNFSSTNYLKLPLDFKPEDKSWSITLKVKTPMSLNRRNLLLGTIDGYFYSTCVELSSNFRFGSGLTSNGTSWDLGWISTSAVSLNTWYYLRLSFTGTSYKLEMSSDGEHWNLENTIQSSTILYQKGTHYLQIGTQASDSDYYEGTVDLKECKIVVDGKTIWTGAKAIKDGYVSLINPQGTTKAVVTGIRNPTKDYTGSIAIPADIAKKLSLTSDLSEIVAMEDI